ncbi:MAG: biotin--[acetyl-CoA-carboxylase] ligase [Bacteriovoracaceae bacterium]|nr:biotin--[acetyl-CoA-carboxylase] ligase [Bacteriovoracaceae bacterium]
MKHIHLDECHSTQEYLKVQAEQGLITYPAMVSTEHQTNGIGRRGNSWTDLGGALCFSALFPLKNTPTIIPLEMGTYLIQFFKAQWGVSLYLKWPNDILNAKNQKVGGILIHKLQDVLVIGIGLNLFEQDKKAALKAEYPVGYIFEDELNQFSKKNISLNIYRALLKEFERNQFTKEQWNKSCIHLNKSVTLTDDNKSHTGIFIGINADGAAMINIGDEIKTFYTGNLRLSDRQK